MRGDLTPAAMVLGLFLGCFLTAYACDKTATEAPKPTKPTKCFYEVEVWREQISCTTLTRLSSGEIALTGCNRYDEILYPTNVVRRCR
jgi:hypothetical protein